jgi:hypothetical protein
MALVRILLDAAGALVHVRVEDVPCRDKEEGEEEKEKEEEEEEEEKGSSWQLASGEGEEECERGWKGGTGFWGGNGVERLFGIFRRLCLLQPGAMCVCVCVCVCLCVCVCFCVCMCVYNLNI